MDCLQAVCCMVIDAAVTSQPCFGQTLSSAEIIVHWYLLYTLLASLWATLEHHHTLCYGLLGFSKEDGHSQAISSDITLVADVPLDVAFSLCGFW